MDLDLLSKILQELVLEHDRVSLPGMGSFIAEKAPSVFSDSARVIHPPFRRILFRPSEIWNDQLLENKYAQEKGCDIEVAKSEIATFIKSLREDLGENKSYRIPNFGTMRATEQNDYFFVADKELFNYVETFGLGPVNIKFLPRRGEVESLSGKPQSSFFKKDIREILSSSIILPEEESFSIEEEPFSQENELSSQEKASTEESNEEGSQEDASQEDAIQTEQVQEEKPVVQEELSNQDRFIKKFVIIFSAILLIILIIVLLVVFKDDLRPFWEWILYNKEEREFLKTFS